MKITLNLYVTSQQKRKEKKYTIEKVLPKEILKHPLKL
jgi:hypothetical protein